MILDVIATQSINDHPDTCTIYVSNGYISVFLIWHGLHIY